MKVERILAPNPGPYTGPGTNTYLLELDNQIVVIDPGPIDSSHQNEILQTIGNRKPSGVIVTHTHPDHAPMANPLAKELECPAYGYAPGNLFDPDIQLDHQQTVSVGSKIIEAIYTPGHADDHLCLRVGEVLFTGDHILGGSSVVVQDMKSYLESLQQLQELQLTKLYPGHGYEMDQPTEVISWYLAHRQQREQQIIDVISAGTNNQDAIVEVVYSNVDPSLMGLAAISVQAHLEKLRQEGTITISLAGTIDLTISPDVRYNS